MTTINRFEDILAWQKAHAMSDLVYELSDRKAWNRDWKLRSQIRDAADSAEANIAEGFNRRGDREFRQFLKQAKGSAGEVRSHAYRAKKCRYITPEELKTICEMSEECERLIQGFINYLNTSLESSVKGLESSVKGRGSRVKASLESRVEGQRSKSEVDDEKSIVDT